MKIAYTCFEVSNSCNMDCKFCFSKWRDSGQKLSTQKVKQILQKLRQNGLKAINLTGGDPLLRDDIIEICKFCKSLGIFTIISTNGILLKEKEEVLKCIDSINLPLDAVSQDIHNKMRPCAMENHHGHILQLIEYISQKYPNIKIKINTIVTKKNIDEVPQIGLLFNGRVYKWKLGKFFASGYGKNFKDEFDLTSLQFKRVIDEVEAKYDKDLFVYDDFEIEDENDIFLDSDGKLNIVATEGVKVLGDVDILEGLKDASDPSGLNNNYFVDYYFKSNIK